MISQSPIHAVEHSVSRWGGLAASAGPTEESRVAITPTPISAPRAPLTMSAATQGHATSFTSSTRGYAVSRVVSGRVTVQS
jgi:hypothetical protein